MKKAFIAHGLLMVSKDLAIILSGNPSPTEVEVPEDEYLIDCDKIHINPDYNHHDSIEVQLGNLSDFLEVDDLNGFHTFFNVSVNMQENNDPETHIVSRGFIIENLSMELQKRIHDKAEEMYQDWLKTIVND